MSQISSLELFVNEAPEVQKSYAEFINSLIALEGLDAKTKQLIYIGMKIIADDEKAVLMHVKMVKNLGATREEVKSTVLLAVSVIGLKAVSKFMEPVLNAYDED